MQAQKTGVELRQLRDMARLSQFQLSIRTGIPRDRLSRFECGYSKPTPGELQKLETAIDQAIDERNTQLAGLRLRDRDGVAIGA